MTVTNNDVMELMHNVNCALQASAGETPDPWWKDLPPDAPQRHWTEQSLLRLRDSGFSDPARIHLDWLLTKLAEGYTYGEEKSVIAKTHPLLVPFNALPFVQQLKDTMQLSIVNAVERYEMERPQVGNRTAEANTL